MGFCYGGFAGMWGLGGIPKSAPPGPGNMGFGLVGLKKKILSCSSYTLRIYFCIGNIVNKGMSNANPIFPLSATK